MSSNPLRLQILFNKYIKNNCSKEELKEFWHLMAELSDNDLVSDEVRRHWDSDAADNWHKEEIDGDKIFEKVLQRAAERETAARILPLYQRKWPRSIAVAASVLLAVAIFFLFDKNKPQKQQTANISQTDRNPQLHQVIILADGTKVTLNGGSRLEYPPVFNGQFREVNLIGEAFFEVTRNPGKPFLVHTGSIVTRVLGTSFNIKAFAQEDVAVTVVSGKVQVLENKKILGTLIKNDQILVNVRSHEVRQTRVEASDIMGWKKEDIAFDDVSWERAAIVLANRYGVSVSFEQEPMRNCRFSGTFFSDDELEHILDVICQLTNATWVKQEHGNNILIMGRGCPEK